ncbi:hypothetical protein L2E82_06247 [Cichorium intybus]|uniref:Uncharacterized protein n=1 Tax=Cichorium intybus TaxID=13427 RepID=A0ACB9HAP8_CICIN|nr:hypothetical protein L2E82_06247 [Cichorium intybus]
MHEKTPDVTKIPIKTREDETFTMPEKRPDVTKIPLKTPKAEQLILPENIVDIVLGKASPKLVLGCLKKRLDVTIGTGVALNHRCCPFILDP